MEKEVKRLEELLSKTDPLSRDYDALVGYIERLTWLRGGDNCQCHNALEVPGVQDQFPSSEPVPEPVGEPERAAVVDDVSVVVEEKEEKLTKEKVRAMLKEAAESGVLVQDIMVKFIPQGKKPTFSSIKASDYPALVKELEDAK